MQGASTRPHPFALSGEHLRDVPARGSFRRCWHGDPFAAFDAWPPPAARSRVDRAVGRSGVIEVVHGLCGQPARDFDHQEDPLPAWNEGVQRLIRA
ncbi:hypothetical protein GCM10010532_083650 [Dactylosporangium siamense]|uniref:Uncharacterized protein n=1 Tax=Dactylosporangium siamense TaxID=685454 RepID=A0A919UDT1_9ACTN|nr:hypothetical protein Dsi01nite_062920 [Dactylosporangium siamense]